MRITNLTGVLSCGNVCYDIAVWPVSDLNWNTSTWVEHIVESPGGNGGNTSYVVAKLGLPSRLISVAGADERGDRLKAILRSAGVDISQMLTSADLPTPTSTVLVHRGGDRKFLHRPGASQGIIAADVRFLPDPAISHFHLANPFSLPSLRADSGEILKRAKDAGLTTSLDTGWDSKGRWLVDVGPALPHTDLLFLNDSEAEMLGGVEHLRELGAGDIVMKTGPRGCTVYPLDGEATDVPGFVVEAMDSTGAGDCFAGAFLVGIAHGWNQEACARFANAVGALNVERIGSVAGILNFDETVEWMNSKNS